MEQSEVKRTTNDVYNDLKDKLKEMESPHKRFFRFGVKSYGIPCRHLVRDLRPLITEYYRKSLQEEKDLKEFK